MAALIEVRKMVGPEEVFANGSENTPGRDDQAFLARGNPMHVVMAGCELFKEQLQNPDQACGASRKVPGEHVIRHQKVRGYYKTRQHFAIGYPTNILSKYFIDHRGIPTACISEQLAMSIHVSASSGF